MVVYSWTQTKRLTMEFQLPIGFKFNPTEEQLLLYYLYRKVFDVGFPFNLIPDSIDVYEWEPWVLVPDSMDSGYFFIKRSKRDRTVGAQGRWKNNQSIKMSTEGGGIGCRKSFEFQVSGKKASTGWVMHEYSFSAPKPAGWVLCRIRRSPRLEKMMKKKSTCCSLEAMSGFHAATVAGGCSWPWPWPWLEMPGFKFEPSDQEMVRYYLRNKILKLSLGFESFIPEDVDIYGVEPWKVVRSDDDGGYFFVKRTGRSRTAGCGTWKSNGTKKVYMDDDLVGFKRSLEFHSLNKKASTGWIMHEYTLSSKANAEEWILCRIKRSPQLEKMRKSQACGEGLVALHQEQEEQEDEGFAASHQENQEHQERERGGYVAADGGDHDANGAAYSFADPMVEENNWFNYFFDDQATQGEDWTLW